MPRPDDLTGYLKQQAAEQAAQEKARKAATATAAQAQQRAQLDEVHKFTRKVLAELKKRNNTPDWQLITVTTPTFLGGWKRRQSAGCRIGSYTYRIKDATAESTEGIWLLEDGHFCIHGDKMTDQDIIDRGHLAGLGKALRDYAKHLGIV